jgi:hypothetical protein
MTDGERRNVYADLKNEPADPPFAEPPRPDEGEVGQ